MSEPNGPTIEPGARVAVLRSGMSTDTVTLTTIERLTTRDIVLADGRRFRRDNPQVVINGWWHIEGPRSNRGTWSMPPTLHSPGDPRVVKAQRDELDAQRAYAVDRAYDAWRRDRTDPALARALRDAAIAVVYATMAREQ